MSIPDSNWEDKSEDSAKCLSDKAGDFHLRCEWVGIWVIRTTAISAHWPND